MNQSKEPTPGHDDEDEPKLGFKPVERKPHLLDSLRDALSSEQDQIARAQQRAEEKASRLAGLVREFNNLESDRDQAKKNLQKLDTEHQRLVEGRPGWLEASRANWRDNNFTGSMMAEIDFAIADYPAHRALLVERLEAVEEAIKAFRRQHNA